MAHQLNPDQDDVNIAYGRFLHEISYQRGRLKEILLEGGKLDRIEKANGQILIVEIKKTSHSKKSAEMQLAYNLYKLEQQGIHAVGELRFPEERKRQLVELTPAIRDELCHVEIEIKQIAAMPKPPRAKKIPFCGTCGYREFCWS